MTDIQRHTDEGPKRATHSRGCRSAHTFEVVYYVLAPDYNLYMDCQQQINLELCRRFEKMGVEFAYPTRTLHIVSEAASAETSAVPQEA